MHSSDIRKRFLEFYKTRGHAIIPSASLIPENDPSVLFNTAGMQPLVPYLLGENHPSGKRLVNSQKCVRTNDIEEVGDNTHFTFFEMLGNWSLGDYFKVEQIGWVYEFLMDPKHGLGLDPNRMYVTVFEGNNDAPKDTEAADIWKKIIPEHRIYYSVEDNWWAAGDNGPCGPDTEIFYDVTKEGLGDLSPEEFLQADERQDIIEICNSVFMQYLKADGKVIGELKYKNIDFGGGFERLVSVIQQKDSPYETDLFADVISFIESHAEHTYDDMHVAYRIFADHIRTVTFMISDGAFPGNKDQGYIVRRLLRRAVRYADSIGLDKKYIAEVVQMFIEQYAEAYPNLEKQEDLIQNEIEKEVSKFAKSLQQGLKEFERLVDVKNKQDNITVQEFGAFNCTTKVNEISGSEAFTLFTTYGFPLELIKEEALARDLHVDVIGFKRLLKEHQEKSKTASEGKFKGGLGGDSPKITAFHTATHLLLAGLRKHLGDHVHQAGSNITDERTRFDFTHPEKVPRDVLDQVEDYVNCAIASGAHVTITEMDKQEAQEEGVEGSFWEKYPDVVKVYSVEDTKGNVYSQELCGGPHVETTESIAEFGVFKIKKESSSSAGVRRIKAVFE